MTQSKLDGPSGTAQQPDCIHQEPSCSDQDSDVETPWWNWQTGPDGTAEVLWDDQESTEDKPKGTATPDDWLKGLILRSPTEIARLESEAVSHGLPA